MQNNIDQIDWSVYEQQEMQYGDPLPKVPPAMEYPQGVPQWEPEAFRFHTGLLLLLTGVFLLGFGIGQSFGG